MKVVHIVLSLDCGGLEKLVVDLARAQQKSGIATAIVCLEKRGVLCSDIEELGVEVVEFGKKPGVDFGLFFRLAKLLRSLKADIVHTHNLGPMIYGAGAAALMGAKAITTRHGKTEKKVKSFFWNLNKFIVAVSEDTKKFMTETNRMNNKKVRVVYNGIDLDGYKKTNNQEAEKIRHSLHLSKDSFVLCNVGRLSEEKDQGTLLKAFRKLRQKNVNTDLLLIGDGHLKSKLEEQAKEYKIEDRVQFLGYRDDVPQILNASDLFVLSSYREGLSLALLEAMANEKPVVVTNIGGSPEAVTNDENGYLVPCGFPERIESAVMRLYANRSLAQELGLNGRKRVEENFSLEMMVKSYENLYKEALGVK